MNYLRDRGRYYMGGLWVAAAFQLYYLFLMKDRHIRYLLYLDFLLLLGMLAFAFVDFCGFCREQRRREEREEQQRRMEEKLEQMREENCELQDYVARWCHEIKAPLSAGLLLREKISDPQLRGDMWEQLERIKQQLNSMLSGCRLQSAVLDLQIRPVCLPECVKKSIRNNQFFLIQKGFSLDVRVEDMTVYTDFSWLVYILDQLLNNAVKYAGKIQSFVSGARNRGRGYGFLWRITGRGSVPRISAGSLKKGLREAAIITAATGQPEWDSIWSPGLQAGWDMMYLWRVSTGTTPGSVSHFRKMTITGCNLTGM